MSDTLHCPFCGEEFDIMKGISDSVLGCPKCKHIATIGVWEALIQAKQDLEIAKSYVKGISQIVINSGDNIYIVIGHFKKLAEQTLEQIEHKGQQ